METTNGKRLSTEVFNDRRRRAVKLRLDGLNLAEVAQVVGLARGTIISATKAYKAGGWKAVAIKARGRSIGDGRTLNAEQEQTIRAMICDRTPDQLKLPYALWTRSSSVIELRLEVTRPSKRRSSRRRCPSPLPSSAPRRRRSRTPQCDRGSASGRGFPEEKSTSRS